MGSAIRDGRMTKTWTLISVTENTILLKPHLISNTHTEPYEAVWVPSGEADIRLVFKGKTWRLTINGEYYGKLRRLTPGYSGQEWHVTYRTGDVLSRVLYKSGCGWKQTCNDETTIVKVSASGKPEVATVGPNALKIVGGDGKTKVRLGNALTETSKEK